MMDPITDSIDATITRFHEIEMVKLFDAMLSLHQLRVQGMTFLGTANVAALGVAFTTQRVSMFMLAGILFCAGFYADLSAVNVLGRFYYRGLELQTRFAPNDKETYLSLFFTDSLGLQLRRLMDQNDLENRISRIQGLVYKSPEHSYWMLAVLGLLEIIIGIMLWQILEWPLF